MPMIVASISPSSRTTFRRASRCIVSISMLDSHAGVNRRSPET
jgi:hypothetical protein